MSKVFFASQDEDGAMITIEQSNIEDIHGMLYVFEKFLIASGFSYVDQVAASYDTGKVVWSRSI